jgi:hypothetical protein
MKAKKSKLIKIPGLVRPRIVDEVSVYGKHLLGGKFRGVIQKIETDKGEIYFRFGYYKNERWTNRPLTVDASSTEEIIKEAREKGWF